MPKHFCLCFSLKAGAVLMSFLNLLEGAVEVVVGIIEISNAKEKQIVHNIGHSINVTLPKATVVPQNMVEAESGHVGTRTLFITCLFLGLLSLFNGILLLSGLIQAKEQRILLYILLGSIHLFIVTIFTGIYMFKDGFLSVFFLLSLFMCYGQIAMYHFYEEVKEYNTVKSGVIEITYNGDAKSYVNSGISEEGSVDNTAL